MIFIPVQIIYAAQLLNLLHSVIASLIRMRQYVTCLISRGDVTQFRHCF